MKKFLLSATLFLLLGVDVLGARTSSRTTSKSRTTTTTSKKYKTPTQDQCNIDIDYCFNRYCFDKKTLTDGVYSKCGAEPASTILINVEDCLNTRAVIKELDLNDGCKSYSYNRVVALLSSKDVIETGLKKNTKECAKATKALQAAKQCYAKMISSDGTSSLELYNELDALCGFNVSGDSYMLNRFFDAGNYGDSNVGAIQDLKASGQNTVKRENWRQVVDATLAGYTEIAELACGSEDYKLTRVNQYALDSHDNSQMIALKAEAEEVGRQTANRIVNSWFKETDCVNSPLPEGGLYWDYKARRNPECKIVCREGYVIGKNSSQCVKEKKDEVSTQFIGLNIGNNWGGNVATTTTSSQTSFVSAPTVSSAPVVSPSYSASSSVCSKSTTTYTKWFPSKGRDGVCEVFYPNCKEKYYYRNTESDEFFCIGDGSRNYDKWYNMKISELNAIFGTKYQRMGNSYASDMSKEIKSYCKAKCGGGSVGKASTSTGSSSECGAVPNIGTSFDDLKNWENYVNAYPLANCQNNEKSRFLSLLESLSRTQNSNYAQERMAALPRIYEALTSVMGQIKSCACGSPSTASSASKQTTNSNCEKQVKLCRKNAKKYSRIDGYCYSYAKGSCLSNLQSSGYDASWNVINLTPTEVEACSANGAFSCD